MPEARPVPQHLGWDAGPTLGQGDAEELPDAGDATEEALLVVPQFTLVW